MQGAQLQLSDLLIVPLGLGLFLLLANWREVAEGLRAGVSRYVSIIPRDMSSDEDWEEEDPPVAVVQQQPATTATMDCNADWYSNPLLLQAKAQALAAVVKAGAIGETKGLQAVFSVKPSSTNPRYAAARDALKAELAKLENGARYARPDGTLGPATYPVSGRKVA